MSHSRSAFSYLLLAVLVAFDADAGSALPGMPVSLTDSAVIENLWRRLMPDAARPGGTFHCAIIRNDSRLSKCPFVLLHDGTEVGRAVLGKDADIVRAYLKRIHMQEPGFSELRLTPYQSLYGPKPDAGRLREWAFRLGQWPSGISATYGHELIGVQVAAYAKEEVRLEWAHAIRLVHVGAAAKCTQYYGALPQLLGELSPRSGKALFNWSAMIGLPYLRFELHSRSSSVPDLIWLDGCFENALQYESGEVTRALLDTTGSLQSRRRSYYTVIHAHAGSFHYRLYLDRAAYTAPLHSLWLYDIPMGNSRWATGITFAPGVAVPGISLSLFPVSLLLGRRTANPLPVDMRLATLEMSFFRMNHWYFSLNSTLHLDASRTVRTAKGALHVR